MGQERHQTHGRPSGVFRSDRGSIISVGGGSEHVGGRTGDDEAGRLLQDATHRFLNRPSDEQHRDLWHFEPVDLLVKPKPRAGLVGVGLAGRHATVRADFIGRLIRRLNGHGRHRWATPFEGSLSGPAQRLAKVSSRVFRLSMRSCRMPDRHPSSTPVMANPSPGRIANNR